ncbi:DUF6146 family protein [Flavobacterium chuncheonense]|uniref:DUF6146 family protein n=1 Tax=Flavobacterium chuncheonense TaxID=2026653 RepID=A0ABW5YKM9_9FLAO
MKNYFFILTVSFAFILSCTSTSNTKVSNTQPKLESDTIRIANDEIEYEVFIIDSGFSMWFNRQARPRGFYSQSYLEARNRVWVTEWNRRVYSPSQYNANLYEMAIDYQPNIDYGYEVNYMLYNYLVYFQQTHKQQLGGFQAR